MPDDLRRIAALILQLAPGGEAAGQAALILGDGGDHADGTPGTPRTPGMPSVTRTS